VIWVLFIVVAVLLVGVFAAMVAGRVSYDPMAAPVTTQPDTGLAEDFDARDVATVHFDTALRGYRMDQVDGVLDRLQDRLVEQERVDQVEQERELATLRATTGQPAAATPEPPTELAAEPSVELGAEQPTESRAGDPRG